MVTFRMNIFTKDAFYACAMQGVESVSVFRWEEFW